MSRRSRHQPTPEELRLWRRTVADVAPLHPLPPLPPEPDETPEEAPPRTPTPPRARPPAAAPVARPPALPRQLRAGSSPGVDRRTAERLRRGLLAVDGRIDLHGLSQAEAHLALLAQLARAQAAGRRMILVITGRGNFTGGRSVLKERLPDWLNDRGLRDKVLAFYPAQIRHGGEGAFYVLLRRLREG